MSTQFQAVPGRHPEEHRPGAGNRPVDETRVGRHKAVTTVYLLQNSTVTVAETRFGPIARIERGGTVEWAGPLSIQTLAALEEVTA